MKLRRIVAIFLSASIIPMVGAMTFVFNPYLTPAAHADALADATAAYLKGDYEQALRLLTPLAEMGNPGAEVMLGGMHAMGFGVKRDCETGIKLLSNAAKSGYPHAEFVLGKLHYTGNCFPLDHALGIEMYNKAARMHDFDATFALGLHYSDRTNAPQNLVEAYRWFFIAARDGEKYGGMPRNVQAARNNVNQLDQIMPADELRRAKALVATTFSGSLQ